MDEINYDAVNIIFEYCTIKLCVPRSRGRSGSRFRKIWKAMDWNNVVSSDEQNIEDSSQEHHLRVRGREIMFHQEQCEMERSRSNCGTFDRVRRKGSSLPQVGRASSVVGLSGG